MTRAIAQNSGSASEKAATLARVALRPGDTLGWTSSTRSAAAVGSAWHDGRRTHATGSLSRTSWTDDPIEDLARAAHTAAAQSASHQGPGAAAAIAYELGEHIEPRVRVGRPARSTDAPLWIMHELSKHDDAPAPQPPARAIGWREDTAASPERERFIAAVRRAKQLIAAGDVYQVNLSTPVTGCADASIDEVAASLLASHRARFAGMIELPAAATGGTRTIVCSLSPELGLRFDAATGELTTRPIKGTRPMPAGDPDELLAAEKDRAELDMIIDLMRNDLGRLARPGSVRVTERRTIEQHPGVLHAVAEVRALARENLRLDDALRAVFPFGSITGAPKVRAMQIIAELEPEPRGFYCGSLLHLHPDGSFDMNVGIRTATLRAAPDNSSRIDYRAGAGIVADSDPALEWLETQDKAAAFRAALTPDHGEHA